eukprot:gnl/Dysnectes_brevis/112_a133_13471.p1 GENE.gnl/Dysnectes_brevis/112_a133_13471~~gnl/Dysnectes_brevis/112_a133_13471.p1  ORF type:complete len:102 (-),score=7.16 gnl/Dysnectes_brevis/112_a133_13471:78-356(-)
MEDITKRIESLETIVASGSDSASNDFLKAMLSSLLKHSETLSIVDEEFKAETAKVNALEAENASLKETVASQEYRILHLIRSVRELQKKSSE